MPDDIDYQELSDNTIDEIKEAVEQEDIDLERLLEAERNNKDRKTLKRWLEERIDEQAATISEAPDDAGLLDVPEPAMQLTFSARRAFLVTFIVGLFAGGFFMAGVFAATSPTGPLVGDQGSDSPSDTQDTNGNNNGNDGSNRVMLEQSMLQDEPTLGSKDAPVTIVEYSDFGCPWCSELAGYDAIPQRPIDQQNTLDKIKSNFVDTGKVRFVFKDYPVPQLHPNAPSAHNAANCILQQSEDMFWQYHDKLFANQERWKQRYGDAPDATFRDLAQQVGADMQAFGSCYNSSTGSEVDEDKSTIQQLHGRLATPTIFIGTVEKGFVKIEGAQPYSSLKPLIESAIQNATS
ncbi:MAG: thioredoxin domain-containing protein [Candidatus Nanohaloarchaea archaeon]|nr:thioredoxin domain-containing protein [Candidatus Nanohaloarchaea archaeon]